ncbi:MAG: SIMPL domain-containing protein [Dehalococcoidaceae bacterium]|nr:SIMPL domain-containing protein [Dehalococcoidaceae bacterium]
MQKTTLLTIFLSLALVVAAGFGLSSLMTRQAAAENTNNYMTFSQQNNGIWVSGQGKVTVIPDIVVVQMGVETQAQNISDAQQQAAVAMDAMINVLEEAGITQGDIKTANYNVQPIYTWDEQQRTSIITGYRVANSVTVQIRQVDSAGEIIDEAVRASGDAARVNNVYFTVDDPEQYYTLARERAMADAKSKAEQMAALSGVQLGKPTYISEGSSYYPPVIRYDTAVKEGDSQTPATPISPGETDIIMNVQIVYAIQ